MDKINFEFVIVCRDMKNEEINKICKDFINETPFQNDSILENAKIHMNAKKVEKKTFWSVISKPKFAVPVLASLCLAVIGSSVGVTLYQLNNFTVGSEQYRVVSNDQLYENDLVGSDKDFIAENYYPFLTNLDTSASYYSDKDKTIPILQYAVGYIGAEKCEIFIEKKGFCLKELKEFKKLELLDLNFRNKYFSNKSNKIFFRYNDLQYNIKFQSNNISYLDIISRIDSTL